MPLKTFRGAFQISTGVAGTVQTISTIAAAGGVTKFIRFHGNGRTDAPPTNGIGNGSHQFFIGMAINASVTYPNYCVSTKSQNGVTPSNSSSDAHEIRCIYTILAGSNASDGEARVTAYNANGSFDITIDKQFSAAITVHYVVYYGNGVYSMETLVTTEPVAAGNVDMVFARKPDHLFVIANPAGALTTGIADDSRMMVGAASFRNNAIQQFVCAFGSNDNAGTTQTQSYNRGDQFLAHIDTAFAGGLTGKASISAISGSTVTLNWATTSGGGNREHIVLAITGGEWFVGSFDTVAAGNNISVSNLGFLPEGFGLFSTTQGQSTDGVTQSPDERMVGGFDSAGNQGSSTIEDNNGRVGPTTSLIAMANQFNSIYATTNGASGPSIDARITYTSRTNNSVTMAQPTSDGTGRRIYFIASGSPTISSQLLTPNNQSNNQQIGSPAIRSF